MIIKITMLFEKKQNKTKQSKTKQNKTKQNKTKQNKTKTNKQTKNKKTKQNKNKKNLELRKPLCHGNFSMKFAPYMYTLSKTIILGKNKNVVPFQNGGQITNFYFVSFRFEKPLSQRNFSMKFGSK